MFSRIFFILGIFLLIFMQHGYALLSMELTSGVLGAIPIAIPPFKIIGFTPNQDLSNIIATDLQNSGRFKVYRSITNKDIEKQTNNFVEGNIISHGNQQYEISFSLLDLFQEKNNQGPLVKQHYTVQQKDLRAVAHHISDLIYQKLTGIPGIFSTKLAYVLIKKNARANPSYILEVSDQDGFQPKPLLVSPEPIMSPNWSKDGKSLAYVSFENRQANIYIEDVATGARRLISHYPGINGAPAWSKDGKKIAIVLSKTGSPNIYILDVASGRLEQITNDYGINTEPSWSPDGKSLLFTSNRNGGVQIYQINLQTKAIERISYDGDYNARASYTADGKHIALIHRVNGDYKIALLELETGRLQVLSMLPDSKSPCLAPNNTMVLYDTYVKGKNMLGMVSTDARIHILLPAREGDVQDPAWSPFL